MDTLGHVGFVVLDRSCLLVSLVKDHESLCREGSRARAVGSLGKRQLSWGNGDLPGFHAPHRPEQMRLWSRWRRSCRPPAQTSASGGARQPFQTLGSLGSRGYYQWGHVLHCLQPSVLSDARASESPI